MGVCVCIHMCGCVLVGGGEGHIPVSAQYHLVSVDSMLSSVLSTVSHNTCVCLLLVYIYTTCRFCSFSVTISVISCRCT